MSSRRSIVWLLFLIALTAAAHVLVTMRYGKDEMTARAGSLVPEADRATLLEFSRPGAPAVVAVRSERWKMIAPFAASVDSETILRLLDTLAFAPVSDVLTESEMRRLGRTLSDFGLGEPVLRLNVRHDVNETSVCFGRRTPGGDLYATVTGRPGICVVSSNDFASLDLPLDTLRNPRLVEQGGETFGAIDIRRPAGRFLRVKHMPSGSWMMLEPNEAPVAAARVASLVKLLSESRAVRFVWPVVGERVPSLPTASLLAGYGLDTESAVTITLVASDGSSRYVSFGKNADENSVYALVQNGSAVVTVSAELRERLLAAADSFAELKLFPHEAQSVTTLSVADGETTYLVARVPGGEWRIDSPVSAPADQEVVRSLIQTILSLRVTERDPHGLVISLSTNVPAVAVSRDAVLVQNRLEDLRSKIVLKLPSDRIRRMTVTSAEGRHESAVWDETNRTWLLGKPDGATLNGLALAGVLGGLDPLMARSVVRLRIAAAEAGNYGLEHPRFTIAIDQADEGAVRRNIMIGSSAPGGGAYATVGSTDAVFVLSEETVRALTTSFAPVE